MREKGEGRGREGKKGRGGEEEGYLSSVKAKRDITNGTIREKRVSGPAILL